jgi:hypothetical protein
MESPVLVAAGTTTISSRVGDYSAVSLDPSSPNTFWAASEYGLRGWGTWLATFHLASTTNQPPTVATAANANPNPVTGTTANVSVLGADNSGEASLTYTWSQKSGPASAPAPLFTANGTNAAKNTTVTFAQAGSYTFQVAITDPAGLTATSSVTVIVNQTLTNLTLSPPSDSLIDNGTQQFTATALDQFGKALTSQPSLSWALTGIGSLTSTGLYTAPSSGTGSATVTAACGNFRTPAMVNVAASPPTVVTPTSASPGTVTGTTTSLSVQGTDASGASSLVYTWSVTTAPAGVPTPTFSANGTNAAQNTTATFHQAGNYTFRVTLTDPAGLTATSSVAVSVNQTLASISVTPGTAAISDTGTQGFLATALDQFGKSLSTQPGVSWLVLSGVGTINSGGMYTAPPSGAGSAIVAAAAASIRGTASVAVIALSVPATPITLTAVAISTSQVNLSWTESSINVSGFNVQRSSNGGKSWTLLGALSGTVTTYTDSTVSKGKTYQYRIDAYNTAGASTWSPAVTVTTPFRNPTLAPTASAAPNFAAFGNPSPASPTLSAVAISPNQIDSDVTTFTDTTVKPTEVYQYRAFATGDPGDSPSSKLSEAVAPHSPKSGLSSAVIPDLESNVVWSLDFDPMLLRYLTRSEKEIGDVGRP